MFVKDGKSKFEKNKWLVSDEFMSRIDFFDKFYIKELGRKLKHYLEHVPVHTISTWDSKNKRIYFKIGTSILYYVPIDVNVSYSDYISLVNDKIKKHFPSYTLKYSEYVDYTEDDIRIIQRETGKKLSEIVWDKKEIEIEELGTVLKVDMPNDTFTLSIEKSNLEKKEIRRCIYDKKDIDKNKILDTFLKDLRTEISKKNNTDIKNFILLNSIVIEEESVYLPPVKIDYEGEMLVNFFKINKKFIKEKLICIDTNRYKWDNFEIFFQNDAVKKECLKFVEVENNMYI